MDGTFVTELSDHFAEPIQIGKGFIARPNTWTVVDELSLVHPGPTPEPLKVYSLASVRDYLVANRDKLSLADVVVHVVSPQVVRVVGPLLERSRNRELYLEAQAVNLTDNFIGRSLAIEDFIVGLQTRFVSTDDLKSVLRLFGNVKHEGVKTLTDDGVSQTVTAKAGITLVENATVPNPIALAAFRTFREVEQPASLFVLRVSGASNGQLTAALHEGDGGAWRITAVENIARWLRVELGTIDVKVLA